MPYFERRVVRCTTGLKFGWRNFEEGQWILRIAFVKRVGWELQVWAYISGLIDLPNYIIGARSEIVGNDKLPVVTNRLEHLLRDAATQAIGWDQRDLKAPKTQPSWGSTKTSTNGFDLNVKDFEDGI